MTSEFHIQSGVGLSIFVNCDFVFASACLTCQLFCEDSRIDYRQGRGDMGCVIVPSTTNKIIGSIFLILKF